MGWKSQSPMADARDEAPAFDVIAARPEGRR
jgi:hypothetical protein